MGLLYKGREIEASKITVNTDDEDEESLAEDNIETPNDSGLGEEGAAGSKLKTSGILNAIKDLLKTFMEDMPKSKCENCEANVPTLRSEGVGKIFQVFISSNSRSFILFSLIKQLLFFITFLIRAFLGASTTDAIAEKQIELKHHERS